MHGSNFDVVNSDALKTVRAMLTGGAAGGRVGRRHGLRAPAVEGGNRARLPAPAVLYLYADARINRKCLAPGPNLASLLLNCANHSVMMTCVSAGGNLVTILCLLRDPSPHITLDAFQVVQIFVANPSKVRCPCASMACAARLLVGNFVKKILLIGLRRRVLCTNNKPPVVVLRQHRNWQHWNHHSPPPRGTRWTPLSSSGAACAPGRGLGVRRAGNLP